MSLLDLFAAIGSPIATTAKPAKSPKQALKQIVRKDPASFPPLTPRAPRKETQWTAHSLILYTDRWQCRCGNCGVHAPIFMIHETHGKPDSKFYQSRYRAIGSPAAYPHLSLIVEVADPAIIRACDRCYGDYHLPPQRVLDLGIPAPAQPAYHTPPLERLFHDYDEMRAVATSARALL